MTIGNGYLNDANDVLNIFHTNGNVLIGQGGTIKIPFYVNNTSGDLNIKLALWGEVAGNNHGFVSHTHTTDASSGDSSATINATGISSTAVPKQVKIKIDGTDYTGSVLSSIASTNTNVNAPLVEINDTNKYYFSNTGGTYKLLVTYTDNYGYFRQIQCYVYSSGSNDVSSYVKFYYSDSTTANSSTTNAKNTIAYYSNPYPEKEVTQIEFYAYDQYLSGVTSYITNIQLKSFIGFDGTTEWDTGWLDLSSVLTWTSGWHYLELEETGDVGGTLIYLLSINTGQ